MAVVRLGEGYIDGHYFPIVLGRSNQPLLVSQSTFLLLFYLRL